MFVPSPARARVEVANCRQRPRLYGQKAQFSVVGLRGELSNPLTIGRMRRLQFSEVPAVALDARRYGADMAHVAPLRFRLNQARAQQSRKLVSNTAKSVAFALFLPATGRLRAGTIQARHTQRRVAWPYSGCVVWSCSVPW